MLDEIDQTGLRYYQDLLLQLLDGEEEPESVLTKLQSDPTFSPIRDYIASFDLDMIVVAQELVRKWGVEG